jgi:hypothetical protein
VSCTTCQGQNRAGQGRCKPCWGRTQHQLTGQGWDKFHRAVQGVTRQGRAGPCRAGQGQAEQGRAGPSRAGQGWAKQSWAGLGSLWVTALSNFTGPGALVSHKQLHIRARPGVPIQSGHMGGFNQSHVHHASRHLQACSKHPQW